MLWLMLFACQSSPEPTETEPVVTTPGVTDDLPSTGSTGDTGVVAPEPEPEPEPLDCSADPQLPLTYQVLRGFSQSEDFDITVDGLHVSVDGRDVLLFDYFTGAISLMTPNIGSETAGTRVLADGNVLVAKVSTGELVLVDQATGAKETVASGLQYPNGLEVSVDGYAFVAEQNGGRVQQVDLATGTQLVIARELRHPNGVILSADEQTLYVGSFGGGKVYAIDRLGPTDWAEPRVVHQNNGFDGGYDGINVDMCGNVYFTEYLRGKVWMISALTGEVHEAVDLPSSWIPNMRWGHGVNGWAENTLFVSDRMQGRMFALEIGIPGPTHVGLRSAP